MDLMFQPLRKYAVFSGRARRMEFWLFQWFAVALTALIEKIASYIADSIFSLEDTDSVLTGVEYALYLGLFLPYLAVTVRRLHDSDRSGWWVLIAFWFWLPWATIEHLQNYLMENLYSEDITTTDLAGSALLLIVIGLVWFLVLMCVRGTRGENRFGPDPIEPANPDSGANADKEPPR